MSNGQVNIPDVGKARDERDRLLAMAWARAEQKVKRVVLSTGAGERMIYRAVSKYGDWALEQLKAENQQPKLPEEDPGFIEGERGMRRTL